MRVARVEPAIRAGRSCLGGGREPIPSACCSMAGRRAVTGADVDEDGKACSESVSLNSCASTTPSRERHPGDAPLLTFGSPDIAPRALPPWVKSPPG